MWSSGMRHAYQLIIKKKTNTLMLNQRSRIEMMPSPSENNFFFKFNFIFNWRIIHHMNQA